MNVDEAPIVVLGLGKDSKPRAAVFGYQDKEAAKRAVAMTGLKIGRAETPEAIALARRLPQGKVFANGKCLIPLVKRDLLEKLLAVIALVEPPAQTSVEPPSEDSPKKAPTEPEGSTAIYVNPWDAISVGSEVLAPGSKGEGWFECTVTAVSKDNKKLTLVWRDYKLKPFTVSRASVGIFGKAR